MSRKTISKTISLMDVPSIRLSLNEARTVAKVSKEGFRLKVDESTVEGKYSDLNVSIKINYDLGLLTRFFKPVIDPLMDLAKRLAIKLLSRVSLELVQSSNEARIESARRDKALVASYGKSTATFKVSGSEILDIVTRIKAGDCSIPELNYQVNLDGVSICSDSGDIMLHDLELRNGRMMSVGSALVEGVFYHNTIVDLWDESTIPSWLYAAAMDLLETTSDFYSY